MQRETWLLSGKDWKKLADCCQESQSLQAGQASTILLMDADATCGAEVGKFVTEKLVILSPCEKSVINEESRIKNNMPSSLHLSMHPHSERHIHMSGSSG